MEQRKQILQTAWELFVKYGVRRVSVLDICNEVHISKKTFYTLFASKEDLVDGLMNNECKSSVIVEAVENYPGNVIDYLQGSATKAQRMMEDKSTMNVLYDIEKYYPDVRARHAELKNKEVRAYTEAVIKKGQAQGVVRNDINFELIVAALSLLTPSAFRKIGKEKLCTHKDLIDLFLRMLLNAKGMEYYEQLLQSKKEEKL